VSSPKVEGDLVSQANLHVTNRRVRRSQGWDLERRQSRFAILLLVPAALAIGLFIAYPVVYSFLLTFSKFSVFETQWFAAGLTNYQNVLSDRDFGDALRFTAAYTALYVPLSVGLALLVGVLLQQVRVGTNFFRSLLFLPTVIPLTMGFLMFQWILDPNNGVLNFLLREVFGLPGLAHEWLSDRRTVLGSMVAVTLWGFGPWILMLAGLLSIPKDFYEAARVDGASHWQEFWSITLPQMRNTLMVVTTLQMIRSLKIFVPIYVLTSGGPAGASRSLYYLVFEKIGQNKLVYATTVGWVFTLIVIVVAAITTVLFRAPKDGS
jgi:ABC-type sugar transport system permease subunit